MQILPWLGQAANMCFHGTATYVHSQLHLEVSVDVQNAEVLND